MQLFISAGVVKTVVAARGMSDDDAEKKIGGGGGDLDGTRSPFRQNCKNCKTVMECGGFCQSSSFGEAMFIY